MSKIIDNDYMKLSKEHLHVITKDYLHRLILISQNIIDYDKKHLTAEETIEVIRFLLKAPPHYDVYNEFLKEYIELQMGKITVDEYRDIVLGVEDEIYGE